MLLIFATLVSSALQAYSYGNVVKCITFSINFCGVLLLTIQKKLLELELFADYFHVFMSKLPFFRLSVDN